MFLLDRGSDDLFMWMDTCTSVLEMIQAKKSGKVVSCAKIPLPLHLLKVRIGTYERRTYELLIATYV